MIRDITIKAVLNGYVCTVSCQTVVFDNTRNLTEALKEYLADPEGMERMWRTLPNARHVLNDLAGPLVANDRRDPRVGAAMSEIANQTKSNNCGYADVDVPRGLR